MGVDYLKYDWRIELGSAERMSEALKSQDVTLYIAYPTLHHLV